METAVRKLQEIFRSHPKSFVGGTMGLSVGTGVLLYNLVERRQDKERTIDPNSPMTPEEARVRAMIEQAKDSTWQENLDRAFAAQDRFMLPGREFQPPEFVRQIEERKKKLLRDDADERQRQRQIVSNDSDNSSDPSKRRRITTMFWNDTGGK